MKDLFLGGEGIFCSRIGGGVNDQPFFKHFYQVVDEEEQGKYLTGVVMFEARVSNSSSTTKTKSSYNQVRSGGKTVSSLCSIKNTQQ